jgi:phage tail sheath gpL-like
LTVAFDGQTDTINLTANLADADAVVSAINAGFNNITNVTASKDGNSVKLTGPANTAGTIAVSDAAAAIIFGASPTVVEGSAGAKETYVITITGTAKKDCTVTVTIDTVEISASISAGSTADAIASDLASALTVTGYTVTASGSEVTIEAAAAGVKSELTPRTVTFQ